MEEPKRSGIGGPEAMLRDLLIMYKQQPVLWDTKHPNYKNREDRKEAYQALALKCKEFTEEADEDFVRLKIETAKSCFRKQHKRVLTSRAEAKNPEEAFKPSLWYYNLLLFTVGEDDGNDEENLATSDQKIMFQWSRQDSLTLITFFKKYPILYSSKHPLYKCYRKKQEAVKQIVKDLSEFTGKTFNYYDVSKRISSLRGQFNDQHKKIISEGKTDEKIPSLWCYDALSFLKEEYNETRSSKNDTSDQEDEAEPTAKHPKVEVDSLDGEISNRSGSESNDCKTENDINMSSRYISNEEFLQMNGSEEDLLISEDDIFDTISKNIAFKLRNMTKNQRKIAEKLVNDVMYYGQMEDLGPESRLSLDGQ